MNTNARRSGTRTALSKAIPFVPCAEKHRTTNSPASEANGRADGMSASSAASIPAHGTKAMRRSIPSATGAPAPKSARIAPPYPPYFLPSERKKEHPQKYSRQERKSAGRYPSEKNRTSSAPVINPAPILVPTRKSATLSVFIFYVLCAFLRRYAWKFKKNVKLCLT